MAAFPRIHSVRNDLANFPGGFEKFYKDRLFCRLEFTEARSKLLFHLFNSANNSQVVIGKNNWLFLNSNNAGRAQLNTTPFTQLELAQLSAQLQRKSDYLANHGIEFLFLIAPEKGSVYPEIMPDKWSRRPGFSRLEQLQDYLRDHTTVEFVDAKNILLAKKAGGQVVYLPRDAHWNSVGAFEVSQAIMEHLNHKLTQVQPLSAHSVSLSNGSAPAELPSLLGMGADIKDLCPIVTINDVRTKVVVDQVPQISEIGQSYASFNAQKSKLKAFVLHDSYGCYLQPFISQQFWQTQYHWTNSFKPEIILREKPDVVINEVAERFLYSDSLLKSFRLELK